MKNEKILGLYGGLVFSLNQMIVDYIHKSEDSSVSKNRYIPKNFLTAELSEVNSKWNKTGLASNKKSASIQNRQDQDFQYGKEPGKQDSLIESIIIKKEKEDSENKHGPLEKGIINITKEDKSPVKIEKNLPELASMPQVTDYLKHTELYKTFINDYLKTTTIQAKSGYDPIYSKDSSQRGFSWGEEIINYKERKEMVRVIQMNALMGQGHNHVDPDLKERYEFWKYASKFNLLMSFMMYDKLL